jgi:hypothetical protein
MTKQEQIAAFLDRHITLPRAPIQYGPWGTAYPWAQGHDYLYGVGPRPTVEQVAHELLSIAEFRALQLGTWLGTTDGQVITAAVESVAPPFYREDVELLVAALQHAATLQQQEGQQAADRFALGVVGVAAFVGLAIALSSSGQRHIA